MLYTECSIATDENESPIYGNSKVIIRIADQGAGPYLMIRGENLDKYVDETSYDFFLSTEVQIDEFAAICKEMLKNATEATR